ncbi:MAG: sulfite exporter TauE/SafE family protein, partial [Planctomycetota bacterium]
GPHPLPQHPFEFGARAVIVAIVAGLCGGVLAPLLGVGGGLIVVPVLFFLLPDFGYGPVRACSLATAMFTSGRSAWLHMRDGRIHWPSARWLGVSSIVGGSLGVFIFHLPKMDGPARILLALMLWFVAWRFLRDVQQGHGEPSSGGETGAGEPSKS